MLALGLLVCLLNGVVVGAELNLQRWFFAPLAIVPGALWTWDRRDWFGASPRQVTPILELEGEVIRLEQRAIDLSKPFNVDLTLRPASDEEEVVLLGIELRCPTSGQSIELATPIDPRSSFSSSACGLAAPSESPAKDNHRKSEGNHRES